MAPKRDRSSSPEKDADEVGGDRSPTKKSKVSEDPSSQHQPTGSRDNDDTLSESGHSAHSLEHNHGEPPKTSTKPILTPSNKQTSPAPSRQVFDYGYPHAVNKRIAALRSFDNPALSMAYVDKHVAKMFWSLVSPGQGAKRSNALSRTPSGKHQRFVFVGTVANMYFFLPSGAPPDQVNIRIKPLDDRDRIFANNVLGKYSEPDNTLVTANYADIKLSKWTTYRKAKRRPGRVLLLFFARNADGPQARPFTDIHDARKELLLPVERMPPYRAADLKIDTLVVAEATVTRYHPPTASPNKSDKFSKWTAAYTLNWVAVLDDTTPAPNITAFQEEPEPDIRVEL